MNRGTSRMRLVLAALAVLVLVGVVAVAATGSTPSGTGDRRPPADYLLDTMFSLALLALIPGAVVLVYVLMQRKTVAEAASGRNRRLIGLVITVLILSVAAYLARNGRLNLREAGDVEIARPLPGQPAPDPGEVPVYEPEFAWIPVIAVIVLAATAVVAYVLASRRKRDPEPDLDEAAEEVADSLDDSLDDLRAEPDPRRAVIAAYARLERALASAGLPRDPAETAEEYVARILDRLEVDPIPVRRLTELFVTAKFSQHDVDAPMKWDAIAALERIRDELREVARRRQEERAEALSEAAAS